VAPACFNGRLEKLTLDAAFRKDAEDHPGSISVRLRRLGGNRSPTRGNRDNKQ